MGQPEVGWGGVYPNPIGLPQRPSDSDYDRRCGQCEVRGVPGDVHIDEFISPKPVWTLGIFYAAALQSDASCRRAGSILTPRSARAVHPGSTGRGNGHLEVPGP